jgi:hypothetical protein
MKGVAKEKATHSRKKSTPQDPSSLTSILGPSIIEFCQRDRATALHVMQVSESPPPAGFRVAQGSHSMYLLYLDEFGHAGRWIPDDARFGHHPLFGLAGFATPGNRWADLDRHFFRLKCDLYKKEIAQFSTSKGERAERFEPKQLKSYRDMVFAAEVLNLVHQNQGHLFAYGYHKGIDVPRHRDHAIYIGCVEHSMLNFEKYLKDRAGRHSGQGVVIMDRRNDALNSVVLGAAQSYLFGRALIDSGRPIERIIEAPLLVPSEWYHGVQMADMVGRAVASVNLHRLGLQRGLAKFEAILGPKIDAFGYGKDNWHTVFLKAPAVPP